MSEGILKGMFTCLFLFGQIELAICSRILQKLLTNYSRGVEKMPWASIHSQRNGHPRFTLWCMWVALALVLSSSAHAETKRSPLGRAQRVLPATTVGLAIVPVREVVQESLS